MKKENGTVRNGSSQACSFSNNRRKVFETARALPAALRWSSGNIVRLTARITIAAIIAFSFLGASRAWAQSPDTSPRFKNPAELASHGQKLHGVMQMVSGKYEIPIKGYPPLTLRQFRSPQATGQPPPGKASPGPTLRARLGDTVEISFLNKVDLKDFSYSYVTNSKGGSSDGCDKVDDTTGAPSYPFADKPYRDTYPNCFHGSSTANIHFHGTHTSPDGLGDNVLVQVLPQLNQVDNWPTIFTRELFNINKPPDQVKWRDMPRSYREAQERLIKEYDKNLPPAESLWKANDAMIKAGLWPQYLMGAFPNFFKIPDYDANPEKYSMGQAPGTHWYHAHKHGSTSLHILNGLAGVFIIESNRPGGYDQVIRAYYRWGNSYGDHEKIIIFQEYDDQQGLERPGGAGTTPTTATPSRRVLVNGLLTPTITMKPDEVQLWRFLNATEGNNPGKLTESLFKTDGFKFKQTAMDGVQFSPTNYDNQPFLEGKGPARKVPGGLAIAAGNRADVLVQAPTKPDTYAFKNGATTLFFVTVSQDTPVKPPPDGPFPKKWADMPKFLEKGGIPDNSMNPHPVKFEWEDKRVTPFPKPNPPRIPPHFMIDGKQFQDHHVDQCMLLDAFQDWVIENRTSTPHPFHIHINPFQVIRIDTPDQPAYEPKDNFVWQDVVTIPPAKIGQDGKVIASGKVTIRQRFVDFTGTYVLHCHILAHEDRGMMQMVRVLPKGSKIPEDCQVNIPAHH